MQIFTVIFFYGHIYNKFDLFSLKPCLHKNTEIKLHFVLLQIQINKVNKNKIK